MGAFDCHKFSGVLVMVYFVPIYIRKKLIPYGTDIPIFALSKLKPTIQ